MRHVKIFFILLFLVRTTMFSQSVGKVSGSVVDEKTGEPIIGANIVLLASTLGAVSDLDGKFLITKIPPGTYDAKVSMLGYASKVISKIQVEEGSTFTIHVTLIEQSYSADEVVVTADAVHSTEAALLSERKKAASIGDGVSAEQIKRTPDATSGDALKRVTGVSLVDNKFVFIRGITDRYNETTLDGAQVTSTEVGKKSFSFDLLPANLIENTSVVKSATPDLPGDFSGGLVQLNTLDFPTENSFSINLGSSYNSSTTSKDFLRSQNGSRDWLGFDDGIRGYPGDQPDGTQLARELPNDWAPHKRSAPYNNSFSLSLNQRFDLSADNPTAAQLGFVGAVTYKNTYQRIEKINDDYVLHRYSIGSKNEYDVLWGTIVNLSLKLTGLHKISFKNSFNQSGNDEVSLANINDYDNSENYTYTTVRWVQRSAYTGQLTGEHNLPSIGGLTIQWRGAVSSSRREDPDWKQAYFYRSIDDLSGPYNPSSDNNREWAKLNMRSRSLGIDATLPLTFTKLKFGGFAESRTADYKIRYFDVTPSQYPHPIPDSIATLPLDKIYAPENFGTGKFLFGEKVNPEDTYNGDQTLYAGYFMTDMLFDLFSNKFRFVGGARLENASQNVIVPQYGGTFINSLHKNNDALPSFNLTYFVNDITNLRLAYSHSVNRPDFRELASTGFFDFVKYENVKGNPDLGRSLIRNYDCRLEIFPAVGELVALSYFYKNLSDPIEEYLEPSSSRYTHTWNNSPNAKNSGWELELRKSLGFLGGYFGNFSVMGNYTRVQSDVLIIDSHRNNLTYTRPLQGQSPYVINLSFLFTEPTLRTSLNLLYNKFGSRLEAVGGEYPDIYEEARDLVDLAVTQQIIENVEAKFTIKNLGNKDRVLTRGIYPYEQATIGRTLALQLSARL